MAEYNFQDRSSISGQDDQWIKDCQEFADNDSFKEFRNHPTVCRIVEGSPIRAGKWNLRRLRRNEVFHMMARKFSTSDIVGNPKNLICLKLRGNKINFNPTTLRYINNIFNLMDLFGVDIFAKQNIIVEIGAGYGGECKIANDFSVEKFQEEIRERWKIFDLESSLPLISKWLEQFGYKASLNPEICFSGNISLVISNAAFSEMSRDLQEKYFKELILPACSGYFVENFSIYSSPFGGFSRGEFIDRLKKAGKYVFDLDARTWLSNFDRDAKSGLIIFSNEDIVLPKRNMSIVDSSQILFRKFLYKIRLAKFPVLKKYLDKIG
ncbi:hypothetical protein KKH39_04615 [Patescibacteria group bacterium]|nr:hypothetical protein [Patescibacteria group bacterium]